MPKNSQETPTKPAWWTGTFEERMARREARRGPEFYARLAERARYLRYREIWAVILHDEALHALPHYVRIGLAPRVRGCGRAAKKAGF